MRKDRDDEDSQKQWDWLEAVLRKCQYNYKTVSKMAYYKNDIIVK